MQKILSMKVLGPIVVIATPLALSACNTPTYGTGTSAAAQTIKDVSGILTFGSSKSNKEPIEYGPRAPIVEPPAAVLPPPGSSNTVAANTNWPVDPDEEKKRIDALVKEAAASGEQLKFDAPKVDRSGREPPSSRSRRQDSRALQVLDKTRNDKNNPEAQKLLADAKASKTGGFDETGAPVRQYLIDPPSVYREPDPLSPVEITEKPKKKSGWKMPDLWPF